MKKLLLSCLAALCLVGCSSTPAPTNQPDKDTLPTQEPSKTPDTKEPEKKDEQETPVAADTKKTVCTISQPGIDVLTTFEHDGVKLLKQINTNTIVLSESNLTKEQIEIAATAASESYSAIKGVTYTYEFIDDDTFTETTTIDFEAAPIKDLQDAGIVEEGEADFIGIKETLELNAAQGVECKDAE